MVSCRSVKLSFFFQAEDGIRDLYVTGVQTCALPIFQLSDNGAGMSAEDLALCTENHATSKIREYIDLSRVETLGFRGRSEERRVGKEGRSGLWWWIC